MSKLHEQMFDAGFKAGQEAALAEIARLRASKAELLAALRVVRSMIGHPDNVSFVEQAIANAEKGT